MKKLKKQKARKSKKEAMEENPGFHALLCYLDRKLEELVAERTDHIYDGFYEATDKQYQ